MELSSLTGKELIVLYSATGKEILCRYWHIYIGGIMLFLIFMYIILPWITEKIDI